MTYQEMQRFPIGLAVGIGAFMILTALLVALTVDKGGRAQTFVSVALVSIPVLLLYFAFRLETTVSEDRIGVRLFPLPERIIEKSEIAEFEVVDYKPLRDFGGWGIRYGKGGKMYNAQGTLALKFVLRSGGIVYIGTQKPDEFAKALAMGAG